LIALAVACHEPKEAFGHQLQEILGLAGTARITKKYRREQMAPTQYQVAMASYEQLLKRQVEQDVPDVPTKESSDGNPPSPPDAPQPTRATPAKGAGVPPVAPASSAPEADGAEAERAKLWAEVAIWALRVSPQEVEHILIHHPYARARALLWKVRLPSTSDAVVAD
jgi:hypothetical protein